MKFTAIRSLFCQLGQHAITASHRALLLCAATVLATGVMAQPSTGSNSGYVDPDSRKSLRIRINLQSTYRISNVEDIHLYIDQRDKDHSIMENICIQGTRGDKYKLTAHAQKTGDLSLVNEKGEKLPFMLFFYPNTDKYIGMEVHPRQAGMEYNIDETKEDCDGRETSALHFIFPREELQKAKGGNYTADLVLSIGSG